MNPLALIIEPIGQSIYIGLGYAALPLADGVVADVEHIAKIACGHALRLTNDAHDVRNGLSSRQGWKRCLGHVYPLRFIMNHSVIQSSNLSIPEFPTEQLAPIMVFVPDAPKKNRGAYRTELAEYLDQQFLAWRKGTPGERGSFAAWAKDIGIVREKLNNYINRGTLPREDGLQELASAFGEEVYLKAGKLPPDERLHFIFRMWGLLPDNVKRRCFGVPYLYDN
jgi:hypothetical protein